MSIYTKHIKTVYWKLRTKRNIEMTFSISLLRKEHFPLRQNHIKYLFDTVRPKTFEMLIS